MKRLGEPGAISKHRDNESQVTAVALLSDPRDFQGQPPSAAHVLDVRLISIQLRGGTNYFEGDAGDRFVRLGLGDAVFFYGDRPLPARAVDSAHSYAGSVAQGCYHWITPVTAGRRVVLQMELSRDLPWWKCW